MKVYVIEASAGSYDDYVHWSMHGYLNKERAEHEAQRLNSIEQGSSSYDRTLHHIKEIEIYE